MKLIRYGQPGNIATGVIIDGVRYRTAAFGEDYNERFFETNGIGRLAQYIAENKNSLTRVSDGERLDSPVARPSKIICIGLNYADHAKETGATVPPEPVIFMKATTSLSGPNDAIVIPRNSVKTDWEVELAIVIGKKASYVDEAEAMNYVAGYVLHNDVSEREYQLERAGTWDKGKGCDTFAPLGPFLATKDEIANPDNLRLWLKVNGKTMQDGTTANFIFKLPHIVSYVSQFMTLLPGDVISTGTPAGVGMGFTPSIYLKPGDVVELGIEGLGTSSQTCVAWSR